MSKRRPWERTPTTADLPKMALDTKSGRAFLAAVRARQRQDGIAEPTAAEAMLSIADFVESWLQAEQDLFQVIFRWRRDPEGRLQRHHLDLITQTSAFITLTRKLADAAKRSGSQSLALVNLAEWLNGLSNKEPPWPVQAERLFDRAHSLAKWLQLSGSKAATEREHAPIAAAGTPTKGGKRKRRRAADLEEQAKGLLQSKRGRMSGRELARVLRCATGTAYGLQAWKNRPGQSAPSVSGSPKKIALTEGLLANVDRRGRMGRNISCQPHDEDLEVADAAVSETTEWASRSPENSKLLTEQERDMTSWKVPTRL